MIKGKFMNVTFNSSSLAFRGWEVNDLLKGQLDNENEFKALADAAKVDIKSSKCPDSKYLPNHDMYLTTSTKKVDEFYYFATDCYITQKDTPKNVVSKNLFESAEKSVGKLYGILAKNNLVNLKEPKKSHNIFKKILQFFRK